MSLMKELKDPIGVFKNEVQPTEAELKIWAYGNYYQPDQDFQLFVVDNPYFILELAADPKCPTRRFFLDSLYVWVARQAGEEQTILTDWLATAAKINDEKIKKLVARARRLQANPKTYTYAKWGLEGGYAYEIEKKLIIFEGIASSGKTTLINLVQNELKKKGTVRVISEEETLMPLIDNTATDIAATFLHDFLKKLSQYNEDTIIIDRFHFTHAFRTNSDISDFDFIEDTIARYTDHVILLTINDDVIKQRIDKAAQLRGGSWKKGKQGTIEEKAEYYKNQQTKLVEMSHKSRLWVYMLDTKNMDWPKLAAKIVKHTAEHV